MENSRNKQFISFKLHAVLKSMMTSHTVLRPAIWDVNLSSVQCIHTVGFPPINHLSHLGYQINCQGIEVFAFK